jgi:ABC-type multidrug transport system ATPase subunit
MSDPILAATGVSTVFGGPVDLEVAKGGCLGIAGLSGSGKSLLLRALADLDEHAGEISLGGVEQLQMAGPDWRKRVGYLPAESHWWLGRAGDHFSETDDGLEQDLGRLFLAPEILEKPIEQLSSGERQRLAFLRLLRAQPEVLLLDEPTSNLDGKSAGVVESWVSGLRSERGVGVIWVSHDLEQLWRVADRVRHMDGGLLS